MKTKTIQKILSAKFNAFLVSIEDEKVKELVKSNTIITGGCIASMFLNEKINDYDLYFTNKETTLAVANYYVAKFKNIPEEDKNKTARGVEMRVVDCDSDEYKHGGSGSVNEEGRIKIYIGSKGIAGEDENSKLYFDTETLPDQNEEDYVNEIIDSVKGEEIKIEQKDARPNYRPVFLSANAITLSNNVQLVIRFYGAPEQIHLHYDYAHCTNYWLSKDGKLYTNPKALECLLSKELVYVGSKYPLCSIIRTRKFIKRGWTINAGTYLKMMFQVSQMDLTNINVLEDQLIGVDTAFFAQLVSALQSKQSKDSEFRLSFGYLATIIDKIF